MIIDSALRQEPCDTKAAKLSRRFHFSDVITAIALQEGIAHNNLLSSTTQSNIVLARGRLYYIGHYSLGLSNGILARLSKKKQSYQILLPFKRYQQIADRPAEILIRKNIETIAELIYKKELRVREVYQ